jgi:flagellar biosynthesis/type III secretory pathway chaperone
MSKDDPLQFKVAFENIFNNKVAHLEELLTTIVNERDALSGNLVEEIEKAAAQKQSLMRSVEENVQQSKTLLTHLKKTMPEHSQEAILSWCDPSGGLNQLRDRISDITRRCQSENNRNGIQVRRQSQHVHTALNILRGEGLPSAFYGATGEPSREHGVRSLGKA